MTREPKRTIADDIAAGIISPGYQERAAARVAAELAWQQFRALLRARRLPHELVDGEKQQIRIVMPDGTEMKVWRHGDVFAYAIGGVKADHPMKPRELVEVFGGT